MLGSGAEARFAVLAKRVFGVSMSAAYFHSFELPSETIKGIRPLWEQRRYSDVIFKHPVVGKSVLDIGAWDGYFSFEAEKRGASRVLATDHFCWSGPGWGTKDGFNHVHRVTGSKVESLDVDVFDLDPEKHGTFDVTMLLGVIYHLTDPFGGLKKAASVTGDCLIVETHTDMNNTRKPVMRYYLGSELNGDPTNFWGPNRLCLENMLRELGFTRFDSWFYPSAKRRWLPWNQRGRLIMHAWR